jgi:hypothetical protein
MKKQIAVFALALCSLLAASCCSAEAQQPTKVYRIAYLSLFDPVTEFFSAEGVRLALRERGYVEGQNIAVTYRYGKGKEDRLPVLAAELVIRVDIIVAEGPNRTIQSGQECDAVDSHHYGGIRLGPCRGRPCSKPCPSQR